MRDVQDRLHSLKRKRWKNRANFRLWRVLGFREPLFLSSSSALAVRSATKSYGAHTGADTGAAWSVARGLARKVDAYKGHHAACDMERRNDLDGRGHLSEEALSKFKEFFVTSCTDQVTFMESLMQPGRLRTRIWFWSR